MRRLLVSLDLGASLTKIILADDVLNIIARAVLPSERPRETALKALGHLLETVSPAYSSEIKVILATGGGSRALGNEISGLPIKRVDEIKAIGLGGMKLLGKSDCLVVSAGTGTALVVVRGSGRVIRHVGGTGVGGGTILGLSNRMIGVSDFKVAEEMALRGDPTRVDLSVNDVVGGPIGILPANVTASNFGRVFGEANAEDVAAGIFNMVSQTIASVAAMAAKAYKLENSVVVTGMLAKSSLISRIIRETARLFSVDVFIPENCELAGAIGAIEAYLRGADCGESKT